MEEKHPGAKESTYKGIINLQEFKEKFGQKAWNRFDSTKWNLVKDQKSGEYYKITVGANKDSFRVKKEDIS